MSAVSSIDSPRSAGLAVLLFGKGPSGLRCGVAADRVRRVDTETRNYVDAIQLEDLGFGQDGTAARVLLVESSGDLIPVVLRGAITSHQVPSEEVFRLSERLFDTCCFGALVSSPERGRALLLAPERLARHFSRTHHPRTGQRAP